MVMLSAVDLVVVHRGNAVTCGVKWRGLLIIMASPADGCAGG